MEVVGDVREVVDEGKGVGNGNGKESPESKDDGKSVVKKTKGRKRQIWLKVWKKLGFGRGG